MSKAYPRFKPSYAHDGLVEHFLLTPADLQFVLAFRGDANRFGVALLLKVLPYLGYVSEGFGQIDVYRRSTRFTLGPFRRLPTVQQHPRLSSGAGATVFRLALSNSAGQSGA